MMRAIADTRLGEHAVAAFGTGFDNVRAMIDAGITVIAGTDANETPFAPVSHGPSLHDEIDDLIEAGMTPSEEALRAATTSASEALGLGDRGRLVEGSRADFLLVDGDPIEDITVLRAHPRRGVGRRGLEAPFLSSAAADPSTECRRSQYNRCCHQRRRGSCSASDSWSEPTTPRVLSSSSTSSRCTQSGRKTPCSDTTNSWLESGEALCASSAAPPECLNCPPEGQSYLPECLFSGDVAAQDEGVDLVRTFVGAHRFEIVRVPQR